MPNDLFGCLVFFCFFVFASFVFVGALWLAKRDEKKIARGENQNAFWPDILESQVLWKGMSDEKKVKSWIMWIIYTLVNFIVGALVTMGYILLNWERFVSNLPWK